MPGQSLYYKKKKKVLKTSIFYILFPLDSITKYDTITQRWQKLIKQILIFNHYCSDKTLKILYTLSHLSQMMK